MANNGPEFAAQAIRDRIAAVGAKTAYIDPGGPQILRTGSPDAPTSARIKMATHVALVGVVTWFYAPGSAPKRGRSAKMQCSRTNVR